MIQNLSIRTEHCLSSIESCNTSGLRYQSANCNTVDDLRCSRDIPYVPWRSPRESAAHNGPKGTTGCLNFIVLCDSPTRPFSSEIAIREKFQRRKTVSQRNAVGFGWPASGDESGWRVLRRWTAGTISSRRTLAPYSGWLQRTDRKVH
jgi:hypothetical protein